jgi:hypothetical protein
MKMDRSGNGFLANQEKTESSRSTIQVKAQVKEML